MSRHLHHAIRHPRTWTAQRRHPRGLVLMYHSVGAVDVDPWGLFIDPANFDDHLSTIKTSHTPMRLADVARAQSSSTLPSRAVAVTFDDGYLNNLIEALPVLERYEVPATVFVIAGAVGTDREFWWDELEQMITGPARLDRELHLDRPSGPPATFGLETSRRGRPLGAQAARMDLYYRVWDHLSELAPPERDAALADVSTWSGWTPRARASHRPVRTDELRALDRHPLVDIGAHTLSHPLLPLLSPEEQMTEMVESTALLEELLGHPVNTFSYPFGAHDDVTVDAARSVGYQVACTTRHRSVTKDSELLRMPRVDVKNWSRGAFRLRMAVWRSIQ